jgi:hypothetical protein
MPERLIVEITTSILHRILMLVDVAEMLGAFPELESC